MEMNAVQAIVLIVGVTLALSIPAWLWERYQAHRASLDGLPPLDGDPLDQGWGKL